MAVQDQAYAPPGTSVEPPDRAALVTGQQCSPSGSERRRLRWDRRQVMWRVARQKRHQTCGRAARGDAVFIDVSQRSDGSRHAAARGLVSCSSIWCCPVCSSHIRTERARDLATGVENFRTQGGALLFVTLTLRHSRDDDLAQLLEVLYDTWRRLQRSRGWTSRRDRLGIVGFVRSLEVTWSKRAGWHPHLHVLLFLGDDPSRDELDDLTGWLTSAWIARLRKSGRDAVEGPACDVRRVTDDASAAERIAGYTVKGETVHLEMARADLKSGRGSLAPSELLDAAGDGETWAVRAWQEYEEATHGRRAVEWSRNLRALVGLADERSDQEVTEDAVADQLDVVETETVAVLSSLEWVAVASAGRSWELLEVCAGNAPGDWLQVVRSSLEEWHARRRAGP